MKIEDVPVWVWIVGAIVILLLLLNRSAGATGTGPQSLPSDQGAVAIAEAETQAKTQVIGDYLAYLRDTTLANLSTQRDVQIQQLQTDASKSIAQYYAQALNEQNQLNAQTASQRIGSQNTQDWLQFGAQLFGTLGSIFLGRRTGAAPGVTLPSSQPTLAIASGPSGYPYL